MSIVLKYNHFWSKVDKTDSCWNWTGCLSDGYGQFGFNNKVIKSHRLSYELLKGKIPEGLQLDHLCRNRACVNPDHLEPVTNKVNVLRGIGPAAINKRKTQFKRGHEFSPENVIIQKGCNRLCKTCTDEYKITHKESHKNDSKQWRINHQTEIKIYNENRKESTRQYMKEYMRRRRANAQ